jgi:glycosyltransferase involved in cell wall biosynthesis
VRVLLVANTLPPHDLSGVGEQVVQLAAGLRELGHEVRILGRGAGGARGPKAAFPLAVVPALARAVRAFDPDVVQGHESDVGLGLGRLRRARGAGRRPLLVALLQVSYVEERSATRELRWRGESLGRPGAVELRFRRVKAPAQIALGRRTARAADLVLAPSAATAAEIARDYGVRPGGVLPNVTGGVAVVPEPVPALGDERGGLLFVGRLRIRKGVEVLLRALADWPPGVPAAPPVWIAGEGEHRDGLEAISARLGLRPERVRFLGRASAGQVRELLDRSAALVVPSIYEGMPLVVLEAMAAGRPVVASRVSGIPEVVLDGETGWLVAPEEPAALGAALRELLLSPGEAARRGEAGRRRVEECYRPRHAAAIWLAQVTKAMEGTRR